MSPAFHHKIADKFFIQEFHHLLGGRDGDVFVPSTLTSKHSEEFNLNVTTKALSLNISGRLIGYFPKYFWAINWVLLSHFMVYH